MTEEETSKTPDEEQGIEPEPTEEEKKDEMEQGEADEETYDKEGRENLSEDDEITPEEEGFMEGYDDAGEETKKDKEE